MYDVRIGKTAEKILDKLPDRYYKAIIRHICNLEKDPRPAGCIKLSGTENYRIRVGVYRIIYSINDHSLVVIILEVGHRRDIYK
jgi:mRNA interferase RelE/StbE